MLLSVVPACDLYHHAISSKFYFLKSFRNFDFAVCILDYATLLEELVVPPDLSIAVRRVTSYKAQAYQNNFFFSSFMNSNMVHQSSVSNQLDSICMIDSTSLAYSKDTRFTK